ncbi:cobalt-precorrin 5A hydrolase [Clostridium aminobutyricum]|uniref:Cobalt-precorrin 5A hydrolase n=1 Tax=Clostridium aminobutyricum TaxID=33953 RepID=A0A939IGR8_CLOAM|nr:cobalt-precorrin 5A hydrolase [Clostridium aminobutyricum]MBN7772392.1 cobalt-precorrin 5A hydrolase [Clostridium aminobutyricum]
MRIALIAFTNNGGITCQKVCDYLLKQGNLCTAYGIKGTAEENNLIPVEKSLTKWTKEVFEHQDAIVFIGATGIAVRAIAPYIKSKKEDPAIVVIDEKAHYVISLLSGHLGGANQLAQSIAESLDATPIITTATDINGKFAVDLWAKENGLTIKSMKAAKQISADILKGKTIYIYSESKLEGEIPPELSSVDAVTLKDKIREGETCIVITEKILDSLKGKEGNVLQLIPRSISIGLGCKKGVSFKTVDEFLKNTLAKAEISAAAVERFASIDLKKEEAAFHKLSTKWKLPFYTYSGEELLTAQGEFTESNFVRSVTGVENVCERAAVLSSDHGTLLWKKEAYNGVTIAIARKETILKFSEKNE